MNDSRPATAAKRGPGSGLRQARNAAEAAQWRSLFEALASTDSGRMLPHFGLRAGDGDALRDTAARVCRSLSSVLAETRGPELLARTNATLALAYAELEQQNGARVARAVFAAGADGFPGTGAAAQMATWDASLQALIADPQAADLPAAKREIVVAVIGHHLAALEPLDAVVATLARANGSRGHLCWLANLARWRRHATTRRALAKVLTPAEQRRLAVFPRHAAQHRRTSAATRNN